MTLDPAQLLALRIPDKEQRYSEKDVMLYALGVGLGQDPVDERELAFVYAPAACHVRHHRCAPSHP
jgi:hypothetical protein